MSMIDTMHVSLAYYVWTVSHQINTWENSINDNQLAWHMAIIIHLLECVAMFDSWAWETWKMIMGEVFVHCLANSDTV